MFGRLPPPVIVMGMHRSGTSLLTRMLEPLGVFWGREKDEYNESLAFQAANELVFAEAGARWDRPAPLAAALSRSSFVERALALLDREGGRLEAGFLPLSPPARPGQGFRLFGWKDPRNTFTLPLWLRVFPGARVLSITRHGVDAAVSLWRRETSRPEGRRHPHWSERCQTLDGCLGLWKEYVAQAATHRGGEVLDLRFEDLLADPAREMERVCRHLGLDMSGGKGGEGPRILREKADPARFRGDAEVEEFSRRAASDPFLRSLYP